MATYPGIVVYGGDIVSADDINANVPISYVKELTTSRTSTTTLADDDELVSIPLEVGTYRIELDLFYTINNSSTPKLKTRWAFSGTWNSPTRFCTGGGNTATGTEPTAQAEVTLAGYTADSQDAIYNILNVAGTRFAVVRELVTAAVITVAGNLSLQWAQSTSNAAAVATKPGSAFHVRKISD